MKSFMGGLIHRGAIYEALGLGVVVTLATLVPPTAILAAQQQDDDVIAFETDLPRTLVFISERGESRVATREMAAFLQEAGFPLVDPALAETAAQRELVDEALAGDETAATNLGRDFGAQVLIVGQADWGARPDPVDGTLITATSEVSVRALRLDRGEVVARASSDARGIEATEQAARSLVLEEATGELLQETSFVGQLLNDWVQEPWQEARYWRPDPGSIPSELAEAEGAGQGGGSTAPALAILRAEVQPASQGNTRGLGVVKKGDRSSSLFNPVRLEGVVVGDARTVEVEGRTADVEPIAPEEARRLGIEGLSAGRFRSEFTLPMSRDTVTVRATGSDGTVAEAVAAPRIDERWAVVVGISRYETERIPDLEYARSDAESVREFLTSSGAGPFEEDHILFLSDEEATGAAMREAMFVFLQQADWDDLVVIYYAGHGAPDPNRPDNLYLLPHDADLDRLAATAFPMWDVKTALRRQIAAERVVVIADACHSAGTTESAVSGVQGNPIASGFNALFTPSRRLSLTAADTNEFSFEDERWNGGVFTHFLVDALRGNGDGNGDGIVTFQEVYDHVSTRVVEATDGQQRPQRTGLGDIPLAVVEGTSAGAE
ncbi:MAG: caspase domain-containing protein [Longimicrobiales bacterium]